MCKAIVELSDNTCANLLLARSGGPAALTAFWRATGDTISRLDHNEPELNRSPPGDPHDTTTPAAMAGNLRRFVLGEVLSPVSRQHLTEWLVGCKTGNNRLRGGLPTEWKIGDKTGNNGKDASGDIAIAWPAAGGPVLVCAYTQGGSPTRKTVRSRLCGNRTDGRPAIGLVPTHPVRRCSRLRNARSREFGTQRIANANVTTRQADGDPVCLSLVSRLRTKKASGELRGRCPRHAQQGGFHA